MLRKFLGVLYTSLLISANPGIAGEDPAALREGDMKKLVIHAEPVQMASTELVNAADQPVSLEDYRGKWVVVNFWATWCAPCRKEMPSLDRLQSALPDIAVVPIATGRNAVPGIERFFAEAEIENLPIIRDPKSQLAKASGVLGLPVTVILNPDGQEVARLIGDAEWDSDSAKAILTAFAQGG